MGTCAFIQLLRKKQPRLSRIMLYTSNPISAEQLIRESCKIETKLSNQIYEIFARNNLSTLMMPVYPIPSFRRGELAVIRG